MNLVTSALFAQLLNIFCASSTVNLRSFNRFVVSSFVPLCVSVLKSSFAVYALYMQTSGTAYHLHRLNSSL